MPNSNPFAQVLVGIDEEASAKLMAGELTKIAKQLKDLQIKIKADPKSVQNIDKAIADIVSRAPKNGIELLNTDSLMKYGPEMDKLLNKYGELGASIHKVSSDADGNLSGMSVHAIDLQGNIEKINFKMIDDELERTSSTVYTNFDKISKTITTEIATMEREFDKLSKAQAQGFGSDIDRERMAELTELLTQKYGLLTVAINENNVMSKQRKDIETLNVQNMQKAAEEATKQAESEGRKAKATKEADDVLRDYTKSLKELNALEVGRDTSGRADQIREEMTAMKEQVAGFDHHTQKIKELDEAQEKTLKTDKITAWGASYNTAITKIDADMTKLATAYERLDHATARGEEGKMQVQIEAIAKLEKKIGDTAKEANNLKEGLTGLGAGADLKEFDADVKTLGDNMKKSSTATELFESHIGKVLETTRSGATTGGIFKDFLGGDRTHEDMEKLGKAIYGIDAELVKVGKDSSQFKQATDQMTYSVKDADGVWRKYMLTVDDTNNTIRKTSVAMDNTKKNVGSLNNQLQEAAKKIATWGIATKVVYGTWRAFKDGINTVKELDTQLTQIAIVQGKGRESTKALGDEYARTAVKMAQTVSDVAQLNTELIRQGLSLEESAERADSIMKLSSAGMVSMEQSLQVITTGVNAMGVAHEQVADVILKASMLSASNVEGLGEAFSKTASGAKAAGMSIEETTAMIATMKEVTQEGDSQLGTSLKSMLARFNKVNEETGELNENLNDVQAAIESVGVEFTDAEGQIRPFYDIMEDLSLVWDDLDKNTQAYVATQAAGVRQQNRFYAVVDNFNKVQAINNDLALSAGTLQRSYATYLDSTEASSKKLKATLDTLWINFINSDVLKFLTDTATGVLKLVDTIGLLPILFSGLTLKIMASSAAMKTFMADMVAGKAVSALGASFSLLDTIVLSTITSIEGVGVALAGLAKGAIALAGPIALLGGAAYAVGKLTQKFKENKEAALEAKQAQVDFYNETMDMVASEQTMKVNIEDLGNEYHELQNKVRSAGGTYALTGEELERYYGVQKELLDILPDLTHYEDERGNVILQGVGSVETLTKAYSELIKMQLQESRAGSEERISQAQEESDKRIAIFEKEMKAVTDEAYRHAERDEETGLFSTENLEEYGQEYIDYIIKVNEEITTIQNKEAAERLEMGKVRLGEYMTAFRAESSQMSEDVARVLSQDSVALATEQLTEEEFLNFAHNLQDTLNESLAEINLGPGIESMTDLTDEISIAAEELADGLIDEETYFKKMKAIMDIFKELSKSADENIAATATAILESYEGTAEAMVEVNESTAEQMAEAQTASLEKASEAYRESSAAAQGYFEDLEMLNDAQTTNTEIQDMILSKYPEWAHMMDDKAFLSDQLRERMEMEDQTRAETYINMLLNTSGFVNETGGAYQQLMTALGKYYSGDITNYSQLENAKATVTENLINELNRGWGNYFEEVHGYIQLNKQAAVQALGMNALADPAWYAQQMSRMESEAAAANATIRKAEAAVNSFKASITVPDFKSFASDLNSIGKGGSKAGAGGKKAAGGAKKVGDAAKKAADDLKKLNDEIKEYNDQMKAIQDATKSVFDFAVKYINYVKDTHMKANDEVLEKAKKDAEDAYKDAIDIIDLRVEAELNVLQIKEDALAAEKEINEFIKKRSELQGDLVDLEYKAAIASLDTSAAGAKKRKTLEEQLADKRKSLEDLIREREERLQTEAFARQRQFVQDAADWERSQHEITKTTIIANAEEIHADRLAKLEAEYTQEKIYLEAKQTTQTGMIKNLKGDMIPLVAAFEELAKHNGEFWTFFGQEDVKTFGDTVKGVLKHVKDLGFETIQQWKAVKAAIDDSVAAAAKASSSSGGGGSSGGSSKPAAKAPAAPKGPQKNSLVQQVQGLLNSYLPRVGSNRRISVDGYFGPATRSAALTVANSERTTKAMGDILRSFASTQKITQSQINTLKQQKITVPYSSGTSNTQKNTSGSSTSQSRNINMAYDKGGKIEHTGPAEVHGSKRAPEYVFNYPQFKDLARMIAREQFTAPKPKIAMAGGPSLSIDNFIRVDGNIDKDTMPEFKRASENAITQLANKLKGWGN